MEPNDVLGFYGEDPLNPSGNVYIATGDSGQGMTGGTIAGIVIRDLILGRRNSWAEVQQNLTVPTSDGPTVSSVKHNTLQNCVNAVSVQHGGKEHPRASTRLALLNGNFGAS
jgi:hypothetical protein